MPNGSDDRMPIRRPQVEDLTERPIVGAVREAGEFAADVGGDAVTAAVKLTRALLVLILLPILAIPAISAVQASWSAAWLKLLWMYAALFALAALAWIWVFKRDWRGRMDRRSARLNALEDTAELRRRALEPAEDARRP